jgi:hypothetical protein
MTTMDAPAGRPTGQARAPQGDWRRLISPRPLAAGQAEERFASPKAGVLFTMKPQALLASPLLAGDAGAGDNLAAVAGLARIWVSVEKSASGRTRMLLLATGPREELERTGEGLRKHGVTACLLDEGTLLAGEYSDVTAAVERILGAKAPAQPAWRGATDDDYTVAADRASAQALPAGVTAIAMRLHLADGLDFTVHLHAATAEAAAGLERHGQREMLRALQMDPQASPGFLQNLEITPAPQGLRLRLRLPLSAVPPELGKALRESVRPMVEMLSQRAAQRPVIQGL